MHDAHLHCQKLPNAPRPGSARLPLSALPAIGAHLHSLPSAPGMRAFSVLLLRGAEAAGGQAVQAGVGAWRLARLVSEEMERLQPARPAQDDEPVRFRVVSGGRA